MYKLFDKLEFDELISRFYMKSEYESAQTAVQIKSAEPTCSQSR